MKTLAPDSTSCSGTTTPRWPVLLASIAAIAATYVYFLIFAEFAFLEFAAASLTPAQMEPLMKALGTGGIAGSVLAAAFFSTARIRRHLALGFLAGILTALFTLNSHTLATLLPAAASIGLSLGWGTVTLALSLRPALGLAHLAPVIGCGTGLAYALCNLPTIFDAPPATQILIATCAATIGLVSTFWLRPHETRSPLRPLAVSARSRRPLAAAALPKKRPIGVFPLAVSTLRNSHAAHWIVAFFALVFLDSLAFYLIQHAPALKSATWSSATTLHANALTHLAAAILAGFALRPFRPAPVVLAALLFLVAACALLNSANPPFALARSLYVAGVSIYSTALVFIPAQSARPWFAAAFMAIAGWIGSAAALGLALRQTSAHIPQWTLLIALVVGLAALARPLLSIRIQSAARAAAVLILFSVFAFQAPSAFAVELPADPLIAAGRRVYIAEGCIHCHSQFIRPGTPDVLLWGPAHPLAEVLAAEPPLLGNRRQGPDLANVGNRRSPEWNRLHLIAPRTVSPGSRMPSYAYLFRGDDSRGEALLAYLESLGADTLPARLETIARWQPSAASPAAPAHPAQTQKLFQQLCASCHGPTGQADGPLSTQLSLRPPDFSASTWRRFPSPPDDTTLARLIKFGLPGSPMAGHETLPDTEILSLAAYVKSLHAQPVAP
jgi:cbb3-type cytochrome c oxidase subunit II